MGLSFLDSLNTFGSGNTPAMTGIGKAASSTITPTFKGGELQPYNDTPTVTPGEGFDSLKLFGAASQGLSGLGALLQAYNGYKQVQLGRDTFNFQKGSYNQDSSNQARLVNSELQDRQAARISSTGNNNAGGVYDSLGSYMDRNKVTAKAL
jgi:hypothetical protein